MTDSTAPRPRIDLAFPLLSALLVLAWSTGFLGVRGLSDSTPILTILFWRSLMSGLILLPFALTLGPRLDARAVLEQAGFGTFSMFLYLGGFSLAIGQGVPTGLVALITDMLPMGVALLAGPILNQRLTPRQWLGMGTGVAGVALVSSEGLRLGDVPLWALLLPVAGTMAFALSAVLQRRLRPASVAVHQSLCLQCLTAAALFGLTSLPFGGIAPPATPEFALGIGWLVLLATFGGYGTYYLCLSRYPAARVTAVLYLSPPVTMAVAHLAFDEPLSPLMLIGTAVTLAGVTLAAAPVRPPRPQP
ncbi:DMT family transporter [Rhodobacter sp. HX-7-19]|uniref:DMT family transporter n=1 Tax=Paragemmobacter kunshanensis TaxID=2583234 RepID=A0A6M1TVJ8_9RHOB|nr:DMT family transporter [Rhodobacter kunshanensis]NGQ92458.1 DMT family transporter [Rhodobacter kunshanensis]